MKVGEAHELVVQVEQDIAAEHDPGLRAWYGQEFELDSDLVTARRAMEGIGTMAGQLGQLANLKSVEALTEPAEAEELVEPDPIEVPSILTAEELLQEQIEQKYNSCLRTYTKEMDTIAETITRHRKREHEERRVLRKFARDFVDFKDVTGDDHIVLQSKALGWAVTELIEEPDLIKAVMDNSADYAERHGKEVTADPENFAAIIAGSLSGQPAEAHFEKILRSIFSTRHNTGDFSAIRINLANSVFELFNNSDALDKIVRIDALKEPYVSSIFTEKVVLATIEAFVAKNMVDLAEQTQASAVIGMLRSSLVEGGSDVDPKIATAMRSVILANASFFEHLSDEENGQLMDILNGSKSSDPVTVKRLDTGEYLDLGIKPDDFGVLFKQSPLYAKRMEHFSPYYYAFKAAENIMGRQPISSLSVPLSPSLSIEVFVPGSKGSLAVQAELKDAIVTYMKSTSDEFFDIASGFKGSETDVSSYQEAGTLRMVCRPLFDDDQQYGIVLFRPSTQSDRRTYPSLQQLTLNFHQLHPENPGVDAYAQENEALREDIRAGQRRFLGRRPIKFAMLEDIQETGLRSVKLRYDPKTRGILANLSLDDGEVEMTLDRNFEIMTGAEVAPESYAVKRYYENLILRLTKKWTCSREVHTSEGVVSDQSGNAANMGHFAYLRIRDGQRYNFSERQQQACLEEQGTDLALENERLRVLDETGQERNSTYVREAYDPSKPPLEVYYPSL
jgi:hypothetical protein